MNKYCPTCGGEVRFELSINFLVCKGCNEALYVNELTTGEEAGYHPDMVADWGRAEQEAQLDGLECSMGIEPNGWQDSY